MHGYAHQHAGTRVAARGVGPYVRRDGGPASDSPTSPAGPRCARRTRRARRSAPRPRRSRPRRGERAAARLGAGRRGACRPARRLLRGIGCRARRRSERGAARSAHRRHLVPAGRLRRDAPAAGRGLGRAPCTPARTDRLLRHHRAALRHRRRGARTGVVPRADRARGADRLLGTIARARALGGARSCGRADGARALRGGRAQGRLAGGNLALLAALAGTPWAPSFDGAIVVLEDVNEATYRVDRMLRQLLLAGAFAGCRRSRSATARAARRTARRTAVARSPRSSRSSRTCSACPRCSGCRWGISRSVDGAAWGGSRRWMRTI